MFISKFYSIYIFSLILILSIFLNNNYLFAQNNVVLLKGKLTESKSGKIIGTNMAFIGSDGKKYPTKSNKGDGTYQVVIPSGDSYAAFFKEYIQSDDEKLININPINQYIEITQDFSLRELSVGDELFKFKAFEPNESGKVDLLFITFLKLKQFLSINQGTKVEIIVSSYDSWFNNAKRKIQYTDKKGRTKYKTTTYSSKDQLSDLLDSRIETIKNYMKSIDITIKDENYVKDLKVVNSNKKRLKRLVEGKKKKYEYYFPEFENVTIKITKVMKL